MIKFYRSHFSQNKMRIANFLVNFGSAKQEETDVMFICRAAHDLTDINNKK